MSARPPEATAAGTPATPPPRRRRWRWLAWIGAVLLALVLLLLLALWWVLSTAGGRDFALARAIGLLPPGALSVERSEGSLRGPLTLHGVRYAQDGLLFQAERVHLAPALGQLASRTLHLRALEVDDALLSLPPASDDDAPSDPPAWPDVLPELELPLGVRIDALAIRDFTVEQDGAHLAQVHTLTGTLGLAAGALHARELALDSDHGVLRLDADYAPRDNYRTRLAGEATLPAHPGRDPVALRIDGDGDLDRFVLDVEGSAPGPLSLHLDLAEGGTTTPTWILRLRAPELEPALFLPPAGEDAADPGADAPAEPMDIALDARGTGGRAELEGRFAQGQIEIELAPSVLAYSQGVLEMAPLVVRAFDGEVTVEGGADFNHDDPVLDVRVDLAGLRVEGAEGAAVGVERGRFHLDGTLAAWRLAGDADIARDGERAHLRVEGSGDDAGAELATLAVQTPSGDLDGQGTVRWAPALEWDFAATLDGVDPGYFAPDWPGTLRGRLTTQGRQDDDGQILAQASLPDLSGRLRGHPLRAAAEVDWRGSVGTVGLDLSLGESRVDVAGEVGDRLDLRVALTPLNLHELLPDSAGTLRGNAHVGGTPDAPALRADLVGTGLRYGDYTVALLSLRGDLGWRDGTGTLALAAEDLDAGAIAFDTAQVDVQGSLQAPSVQADARGPDLDLALAADLRQTASGWQGEVATLRLAPATSPAWALSAPAAFAQAGGDLRLDRACFVPEGSSGSLCAEADWPRSASVQGREVPLSLLDPWLGDTDGAALTAFGELAIDAEIAPAAAGWNGSLTLASSDGGIRLDGQDGVVFGYDSLDLRGTIAGEAIDATLALQLADRLGRIDGQVSTGLGDGAPLDGQLVLDIGDLTFLELFSTDIASPSGRVEGRIALGGTLAEPLLNGSARLLDFTTELPALGIALTEGNLTLDALPTGEARIDGSLRSGEGVVAIGGSLRFDAPMDTLVLTIRGDDLTVADIPELRARASPDLAIRLTQEAISVRGSVGVPYMRLDLEGLESTTSPSSDVVVLDPVEPATGPAAPLDIDLSLAMGEDVRMSGFGFDGRLQGTLRVRQRPGGEMLASGGLNVTGSYESYGQDLTLEYGRLNWANASLDNPSLDVRAVREIGDITVGLQVRGTALQPVTEVISDPAMDQSEALSYLVLGRSLRTASGEEGQQLDAAAAALSAGSNLLAGQLGERLGFDEAGVSDSRALGGSALTVGRQISPRLYVSYGVSLLGTGQVLSFRYLLARGFDVQVESGPENRASLNWRIER